MAFIWGQLRQLTTITHKLAGLSTHLSLLLRCIYRYTESFYGKLSAVSKIATFT